MFVKICGITTRADAELAASLGVDAIGLNFAASPRRVAHATARDIAGAMPAGVLSVVVFRNEQRDRVAEVATSVGLRAVQLHGQESPEDTRWLAERFPIVIKAFAATDPALAGQSDYGHTWLLIDSPSPGSGQRFDWSVLDRVARGRSFILAGGLHPGNVAEAVATVGPWGVDVASGVESAPGHKDPALLRRFVTAARGCEPGRDPGPDRPFNWEEDGTWR